MNANTVPIKKGWQVGRSIVMELDVVLTGLLGSNWSIAMRQEFPEVVERVPAGWLKDWKDQLGHNRGIITFLEILAFLAGVFNEEDYQTATLAMRSLSLDDVILRQEALAEPLGIIPDKKLADVERLIDVGVRLQVRLYTDLGLQISNPAAFERDIHSNLARLCRVVKNGDRHDWFWMWLDRFFFQVYQAWRESRIELMDHNEANAVMNLGSAENPNEIAEINWLPEQNPLRREPAYMKGSREGKLGLFLWVDPFGLADMWSLYPGLFVVSISQPGGIYQRFKQNAEDLARRTQALADPTRLGILRIIRHFGMINTEIGKFMGVSRPTVSIHAKLLREAGLIRTHEQGREMRHEVVPGELERLFQDLQRFLDLGEDDRPD
jgi:DNA-binding transcriptional ArsR family regulator